MRRYLPAFAFLTAACGGSSPAAPAATPFEMSAGTYTLSVSGRGVCLEGAGAPHEIAVPVTVAATGTGAWSIRPTPASDLGFAFGLSTAGASTGYATGSVAGRATDAAGTLGLTVTSGAVLAQASPPEIGGTFDHQISIFTIPETASLTCAAGSWKLTPR